MGKKSNRRRSVAPAPAGFTREQLANATAARDAASRGTPAVVRKALLGQPIKVGNVVVPILTAGKVLLLEEIGSPLAREGAGKPSNEHVLEALYALSVPAADALAIWARGRDAWRAAVYAFADTIPVSDLPALGAALGAQIAQAESTVIGSNQSPASSGEGAGTASDEKKSVAQTVPATLPGSPPSPTG